MKENETKPNIQIMFFFFGKYRTEWINTAPRPPLTTRHLIHFSAQIMFSLFFSTMLDYCLMLRIGKTTRNSSSTTKNGSRRKGHNMPKDGTRNCQGCKPRPCLMHATQPKPDALSSTPLDANVREHMAEWLCNQP